MSSNSSRPNRVTTSHLGMTAVSYPRSSTPLAADSPCASKPAAAVCYNNLPFSQSSSSSTISSTEPTIPFIPPPPNPQHSIHGYHQPRALPSLAYYVPSAPQTHSKQHMHTPQLSVEPMRTVPSPAVASLSPVSPATTAATSAADYSRTHGHSRQNSLATSRRPSTETQEKPRVPSPAGHGHHHSHSLHHNHHSSIHRIPSPLSGPPHFPPAWSHHSHSHSYGGSESQCPPRSRPPVGDILVQCVRDRLRASKSTSLGRGLMLGWLLTTLGFLAATAFWKGELFAALDSLSKSLHDMGYQGLVVFGVLIFITTIPPLPLYSTLIVLSGYTFGVWNGFVASYVASLVGAVVVFIISRTLLRDAVTRSLSSSPTATSLLQIIPQNPHLLLLIRIAPYPYNLLNVVLASAPSLTLTTYTSCTAISLCKLVLHTWIGAGIHDISAAYRAPAADNPALPPVETTPEDVHHERVKAGVTWGGIILCGVLFVYLTHVAKRAIAKAQDEQRIIREEEVAFLTPMGDARDLDSE